MDKKFFSIKSLLFWLVIASVLILLQQMQQRIHYQKLSVDAQVKRINLTSDFLNIFHLGQKRLISSFMWIETLLRADEKHYEKDDLNSWLFHRFNNIVSLDPNFYEGYLYGGQYLSIIKDDPKAAEVILDKGVKRFPQKFQLRLFKAYNSLFELNDKIEALTHYEFLANHPQAYKAPIVFSILANLKKETGDRTSAYQALSQLYEMTTNEKVKERIKAKMEELKEEKNGGLERPPKY